MGAQRLTQEIPQVGGSEIRAMFRKLKKAGCWWKPTSKNHWKIYDPQGRWVGTLGKENGDITSLRNFRSAMRNNGVDLG